jgi:hypothetical protein
LPSQLHFFGNFLELPSWPPFFGILMAPFGRIFVRPIPFWPVGFYGPFPYFHYKGIGYLCHGHVELLSAEHEHEDRYLTLTVDWCANDWCISPWL